MKLYPYTSNPEAVKQHFIAMAKGKLTRPDQTGYGQRRRKRFQYSLLNTRDSTPKFRQLDPVVQLVTPAAMAVEQATAKMSKQNRMNKVTAVKKKNQRKGTKVARNKKKTSVCS